MNFWGFIALLIGIAIWVFAIGAVALAFWDDYQEEKKAAKEKKKR